MRLPSILTTITALSFLQTVWPPSEPFLVAPLLLLLIVQYNLVENTPALRVHALKSATVGVFLQVVALAGVLIVIILLFMAVVSVLFWTMSIEPDQYNYLILAFQKSVRTTLALQRYTSAEIVMTVGFSVVSSVIHGFTALALTSSYASLLVVRGDEQDARTVVRTVRVKDVLLYGWTGALGMQTSKEIVFGWMGRRRSFFWPIGITVDWLFEFVTVGVWQTLVSLAVAQQDVLGGGHPIWSVAAVSALKASLDLLSLLGTRGRDWEIAAVIAGVGQVGLTGELCRRRYLGVQGEEGLQIQKMHPQTTTNHRPDQPNLNAISLHHR